MWETPGVTIRRRITDQAISVGTVAGNVQTLQFQNVKTIGYLSKLYLYSSLNTGVTALGGGTLAQSSGAQFPQLRLIKRFRLNLQGTAPIYDVDGIDLFFLNYVRMGSIQTAKGYQTSGFSVIGAAPAADSYPYSWPSRDNSLLGLANQYSPYCAYNAGGTALVLNYGMEIPISEWVTFPNVVVGSQQNVTVLQDTRLEVGLLFMQNPTVNLVPQIDLGALYGPTLESPLLATGAATATVTNQAWTTETEFYDIPPNPMDRPSAFQMGWVVQRTCQDVSVAGQAARILFRAAGLLHRIIVVAYNDTTNRGTLVDLTATPLAIFQLDSGASMIRYRETAGQNAYRSFIRYGEPPPGIIVFDLAADGRITQALDTGELNGLEIQVTGLAAAITRLHIVEERLLNVTPQ